MPIKSANFNWILKYKLYHLPFWFAYHYMWWALTIGSAWEAAHNIFFSAYTIKFSFYVIFQAIGVYFNLYFLIPRFLEKGKYVAYIGGVLATILVTAACIAGGYYVNAYFSEQTFRELWGMGPENYLHFFKNNALASTVASMTLAMSIKLTKNWIQSRQREQMLEKEKLETELKFLRSQFNPHFLFNTINSIFVLIHKNPQLASEALAQFSDLLRYQLYECNEQQIPLRQELTYLKNFIELENLRQDTDVLTLDFDIEPQYIPDATIAPFLLIPFVENAFKHVSRQTDASNCISMKLHFDQHTLFFEVSNSMAVHQESANEVLEHKGLGLKNVQRRLDLLYPDAHELKIEQQDRQFCVKLRLALHESEISKPMAIAAG